jgi:ATP-binding cassette, subfamily F, member 3
MPKRAANGSLIITMFDPANAPSELANIPMSELSKRGAEVASQLEAAEARWLEANEPLEKIAA